MCPLFLLPLVLAACAAAPLSDEAVVVLLEEESEGGGLLDASPSPLPRWTTAEWDDLLVAKWDEALARCDETDDYVAYELLAEASDALLERLLGRCYLRHDKLCRWYAGHDGPCAYAAERLAPTH